jgi:hypothetical protein
MWKINMTTCGEDGVSKAITRSFEVGVWKNIRRWEEFSRFNIFEVGDGSEIRFWRNVWCGDQTLKVAFLMLFSIARFKEASMAHHLQFSNEISQWNITFIKSVHEWEVESITSFFNLLYSPRLRRGDKDKICWIPSTGSPFSWKNISRNKAHSRVAFFVWTTTLVL